MGTSSRDVFLQRIQQALQSSNRPGTAADMPPRGNIGYQGAGADPLARFHEAWTHAGGKINLVADVAAAQSCVLDLVQRTAARTVLLGRGPFVDQLDLANQLCAQGVKVTLAAEHSPEHCRESFFAAELGITGVDYLVAETGSLVVLARPEEPRSFSLLPPLHIAVAHRGQLLPDLFDLFTLLPVRPAESSSRLRLPSCLTLITGPSKTGDIELRLVTGVHGPGEVHVVLVTG